MSVEDDEFSEEIHVIGSTQTLPFGTSANDEKKQTLDNVTSENKIVLLVKDKKSFKPLSLPPEVGTFYCYLQGIILDKKYLDQFDNINWSVEGKLLPEGVKKTLKGKKYQSVSDTEAFFSLEKVFQFPITCSLSQTTVSSLKISILSESVVGRTISKGIISTGFIDIATTLTMKSPSTQLIPIFDSCNNKNSCRVTPIGHILTCLQYEPGNILSHDDTIITSLSTDAWNVMTKNFNNQSKYNLHIALGELEISIDTVNEIFQGGNSLALVSQTSFDYDPNNVDVLYVENNKLCWKNSSLVVSLTSVDSTLSQCQLYLIKFKRTSNILDNLNNFNEITIIAEATLSVTSEACKSGIPMNWTIPFRSIQGTRVAILTAGGHVSNPSQTVPVTISDITMPQTEEQVGYVQPTEGVVNITISDGKLLDPSYSEILDTFFECTLIAPKTDLSSSRMTCRTGFVSIHYHNQWTVNCSLRIPLLIPSNPLDEAHGHQWNLLVICKHAARFGFPEIGWARCMIPWSFIINSVQSSGQMSGQMSGILLDQWIDVMSMPIPSPSTNFTPSTNIGRIKMSIDIRLPSINSASSRVLIPEQSTSIISNDMTGIGAVTMKIHGIIEDSRGHESEVTAIRNGSVISYTSSDNFLPSMTLDDNISANHTFSEQLFGSYSSTNNTNISISTSANNFDDIIHVAVPVVGGNTEIKLQIQSPSNSKLTLTGYYSVTNSIVSAQSYQSDATTLPTMRTVELPMMETTSNSQLMNKYKNRRIPRLRFSSCYVPFVQGKVIFKIKNVNCQNGNIGYGKKFYVRVILDDITHGICDVTSLLMTNNSSSNPLVSRKLTSSSLTSINKSTGRNTFPTATVATISSSSSSSSSSSQNIYSQSSGIDISLLVDTFDHINRISSNKKNVGLFLVKIMLYTGTISSDNKTSYELIGSSHMNIAPIFHLSTRAAAGSGMQTLSSELVGTSQLISKSIDLINETSSNMSSSSSSSEVTTANVALDISFMMDTVSKTTLSSLTNAREMLESTVLTNSSQTINPGESSSSQLIHSESKSSQNSLVVTGDNNKARLELGLKQAFLLADTDKSGSVSSDELLAVLQKSKQSNGKSPNQSKRNFHGDKNIGMEDCEGLLMTLANKREVKANQNSQDINTGKDQTNGNGNNIEVMVRDLFRELDVDGDGMISWWEWKNVLTSSILMYHQPPNNYRSDNVISSLLSYVNLMDPLVLCLYAAVDALKSLTNRFSNSNNNNNNNNNFKDDNNNNNNNNSYHYYDNNDRSFPFGDDKTKLVYTSTSSMFTVIPPLSSSTSMKVMTLIPIANIPTRSSSIRPGTAQSSSYSYSLSPNRTGTVSKFQNLISSNRGSSWDDSISALKFHIMSNTSIGKNNADIEKIFKTLEYEKKNNSILKQELDQQRTMSKQSLNSMSMLDHGLGYNGSNNISAQSSVYGTNNNYTNSMAANTRVVQNIFGKHIDNQNKKLDSIREYKQAKTEALMTISSYLRKYTQSFRKRKQQQQYKTLEYQLVGAVTRKKYLMVIRKRNMAVTQIQRLVRGRRSRKMLNRNQECALMIQRCYRGLKARQIKKQLILDRTVMLLSCKYKAASLLQRCLQRWLMNQRQKKQLAANTIQSAFRVKQAKNKKYELEQQKKALLEKAARLLRQKKEASARLIQKLIRQMIAKKLMIKNQNNSASMMQRFMRQSVIAIRDYKTKDKAAILIQTNLRGRRDRELVEELRIKKLIDERNSYEIIPRPKIEMSQGGRVNLINEEVDEGGIHLGTVTNVDITKNIVFVEFDYAKGIIERLPYRSPHLIWLRKKRKSIYGVSNKYEKDSSKLYQYEYIKTMSEANSDQQERSKVDIYSPTFNRSRYNRPNLQEVIGWRIQLIGNEDQINDDNSIHMGEVIAVDGKQLVIIFDDMPNEHEYLPYNYPGLCWINPPQDHSKVIEESHHPSVNIQTTHETIDEASDEFKISDKQINGLILSEKNKDKDKDKDSNIIISSIDSSSKRANSSQGMIISSDVSSRSEKPLIQDSVGYRIEINDEHGSFAGEVTGYDEKKKQIFVLIDDDDTPEPLPYRCDKMKWTRPIL